MLPPITAVSTCFLQDFTIGNVNEFYFKIFSVYLSLSMDVAIAVRSRPNSSIEPDLIK